MIRNAIPKTIARILEMMVIGQRRRVVESAADYVALSQNQLAKNDLTMNKNKNNPRIFFPSDWAKDYSTLPTDDKWLKCKRCCLFIVHWWNFQKYVFIFNWKCSTFHRHCIMVTLEITKLYLFSWDKEI